MVAQMLKNPPAMQETWVWSLGLEDPLEKGLATHSSALAWRIPWTEEPGRLQSMVSQRVRHDWVTKCGHAHTHIQLLTVTPVLLSPQPLASNNLLIFPIPVDTPMLTFHTNGIIQYVAFCVWLLSLSIMFPRFIILLHLSVFHYFLWLNKIPLYKYITLFIC